MLMLRGGSSSLARGIRDVHSFQLLSTSLVKADARLWLSTDSSRRAKGWGHRGLVGFDTWSPCYGGIQFPHNPLMSIRQGHRRPCPYVSTRVGPQARADTIGRRRSHVYCYFKAIYDCLLVTDLSRWTRLTDRTFSTLAPPEGLEGARDRSGSTRALNLVWWTSGPVNTAFLSPSASWPPMSLTKE